MPPTTAMVGGALLMATSVVLLHVAEKADDREINGWTFESDEPDGEQLLYGTLGLGVLVWGGAAFASGLAGAVEEAAPIHVVLRPAAAAARQQRDDKIALHIQLAAHDNRCEAAALMMQRLAARNPEMVRRLVAEDAHVARCHGDGPAMDR